LLSILQHGSLTSGELAQVLREPERVSRMRLKRLVTLGVVEPDPEHPGIRVDPEAHRFVSGLLQGVNLL
jgi:DNA-binding IclR family transcriptional regulator